jgi:hypothetical protein
MREVSGGNYCQNDLRPNFGLGDATNVDIVRVEWPSGAVQELEDVTANKVLRVIEPPRLLPKGVGAMQIQSWKGQAFEVQTSTNLGSWKAAATVTNLTGTLEYKDPEAPASIAKFYRVAVAPH